MNSAKSENCDEVHDLKAQDCDYSPTYQSAYQKYGNQFKPKISAASSTFSISQKVPVSQGKRISPQRLALSGEYHKPAKHEWEILVKQQPPPPVKEDTPPPIEEKLEKTDKSRRKT